MNDNPTTALDPKDLRVDTYGSASGTSTTCQITHMPTGLTAKSHEQRSAHRAKIECLTLLEDMVAKHFQNLPVFEAQTPIRAEYSDSIIEQDANGVWHYSYYETPGFSKLLETIEDGE